MVSQSASSNAMRVVHLPARTPYVWKLHDQRFQIINNTTIDDGSIVPPDVTAAWLLEHRPLTWLDVLHLHHIELEELETLERLLDACADSGVRVVHTAHDIHAMFRGNDELQKRLRLLDSADIDWICLTHGSATALTSLLGRDVNATVIPHGYVADPATLENKQRDPTQGRQRYLLFGAARPNRDQLSTVVNWSLFTEKPEHELHLLMRGFSPAHFSDPSSQVPRLLDVIHTDPRIKTTMRGYPTDDEVITAGLAADALLLPYLWGSHSGQLELAFDLNLLPICSSVGYFSDQFDQHKGLVTEPEWFDWSRGNPHLFGERFVAALERATERLATENFEPNSHFLEYRQAEHKQILDQHAQIYGRTGKAHA
ncbi:hypothetical protein SAMN05216215_101816 [Saccharopolyspora shandongensis]|uniref:Uncharacterized protein n=2 Tax=Saccharopolyspora shandongensis TaxID=418495 RepID=A0A1H3G3W5_9PSEU|nr:hypothetical protein SAMN05216215_101816 [Saccharopolyspora shandongensis]